MYGKRSFKEELASHISTQKGVLQPLTTLIEVSQSIFMDLHGLTP